MHRVRTLVEFRLLCAAYLNAHVITAPGLTKGHGDGLVYQVSGAVAGDTGHGPGPLLCLPPLHLLVLVALF